MSETYTDKDGRTLTREQAIKEAVRVICRQGDERPFVEYGVRDLSDDELMKWIVYPDTGLFADEALA